MSEFPTCKEHQVLKPCPHCEPSKYMPSPSALKVCGDVDMGEKLVPCTECDCLREEGRPHFYKSWRRR